jgi:hypothetical protein
MERDANLATSTLAAGLAVDDWDGDSRPTPSGYSGMMAVFSAWNGTRRALDDMAKELTAVNIRASQGEASRVGFIIALWSPDRHRERLRDREG